VAAVAANMVINLGAVTSLGVVKIVVLRDMK